MSNPLNPPKYVITDGDEGVQINQGSRLAVAGAGFRVPGFSQIAGILQDLLGPKIYIVATEECAWVKDKLDLDDWEQVNAMAQQHIQAMADKNELHYAGYLPFADPKEVDYEIKGHMVRPKGMHLANKICFTLGGGEGTFNLGQYLISADWVSQADRDVVKKAILPQVEFYRELAGSELPLVFQTDGKLGQETAEANKQMLESIGIEFKD